MARFPDRRIVGCVCPECGGTGRPRDAEQPREPWVLLFDRCTSCDGCGAAEEQAIDDLRGLPPHPNLVAPRTMSGRARFGVVGEIVDGVAARRVATIDNHVWRTA